MENLRGTDGSRLTDPILAGHLSGVQLGTWSLGPRSIDVLAAMISTMRPTLVIEFGSGVSTLVLASAMRRLESQIMAPWCWHSSRTRLSAERHPPTAPAGLASVPSGGDRRACSAEQTIEGMDDDLLRPSAGVEARCGRPQGRVRARRCAPWERPAIRYGTLPLVLQVHVQPCGVPILDRLRIGETENSTFRREIERGPLRPYPKASGCGGKGPSCSGTLAWGRWIASPSCDL